MNAHAKELKRQAESAYANGTPPIKELVRVAGAGKRDSYWLNPFPPVVNIETGWNERSLDTQEAKEDLMRLALSIKAQGVLEPITITKNTTDGKYYVDDGHRRVLAARIAITDLGAELRAIPCLLTQGATSADRLFSQLIRNSQDQDLGLKVPFTPIERARVISRLLNMGWTKDIIAGKLGCVVRTIDNALSVLEMPAPVQDMIAKKEISTDLATKVMRDKDIGDKIETLQTAVKTAQALGKSAATGKHIPIRKRRQVQMTVEGAGKATTVQTGDIARMLDRLKAKLANSDTGETITVTMNYHH